VNTAPRGADGFPLFQLPVTAKLLALVSVVLIHVVDAGSAPKDIALAMATVAEADKIDSLLRLETKLLLTFSLRKNY
jgi:hypothetical protein